MRGVRAGAVLLAVAVVSACEPEARRSPAEHGPEPAHVLHTLPAWESGPAYLWTATQEAAGREIRKFL